MPDTKPIRLSAVHSKALLLPMPRQRASDLILRTRLFLERIRSGHVERMLINHLAQVCIIGGLVTRAGHGRLETQTFDTLQRQLVELLLEFDETGVWRELPDALIDGLTRVVNEYDRMLATVRLEVLARASDHLDRLLAIPTTEEPDSGGNGTVPASTRTGATRVTA
ncbi:hypothetical protein [Paraburkholderia humisilvae]|uniref:Fis family transcriptional regulator n=1 Tax=Paraburkholderia humisilvae TaxID=627669 RepID=A0A6J5F6W0_9BURK|nr:hypothetical protein [Paraburkholderia humisilvae]CAB3774628.1 hypothetical protein LMG29542_08006 [Paraburkholderia humisilvae]